MIAEHTLQEDCLNCGDGQRGVRCVHRRNDCLTCGDGHKGVPCVHSHYSLKDRRFVEKHFEEFQAIYTNPDPAYASHIRDVLDQERHNLSRGHICNEPGGCPFENKARSIPPCTVCKNRWQALQTKVCADCSKLPRQFRRKDCPGCAALASQDFGVEIGHTSPVNAPAPLTTLVDYFAGNM